MTEAERVSALAEALTDAVLAGAYADAGALSAVYSSAVERLAAGLPPAAATELVGSARERLEWARQLACAGAAQARAALACTGSAQAYAAAPRRRPACDCRC